MPPRGSNAGSIVDHRGDRRGVIGELRDPPHFFPALRPETPLGAGARKRLAVALGLWIGVVASTMLLGGAAIWPLLASTRVVPRWIFFATPAIGVSCFVGFVVARRMGRAHWSSHGQAEAAALLAARGQCPACHAWMLTMPRDADGRTTCPTCGAAWKVGNTEGCPGCGYDMSSVPATAGPLAICPECATLSAVSAGAGPPE